MRIPLFSLNCQENRPLDNPVHSKDDIRVTFKDGTEVKT